MTKPYEDRLEAIRKLLAHPSREVAREGHDLLFNLWLENMDASDFLQDLIFIAAENADVIKEFEHHIDDLVVREKITDIYLRARLKKLSSRVHKLTADRSRQRKNPKKSEPAQQHASEKDSIQKGRPHIKKIFISYSHRDEAFKDELITMLAGLQRQGIIDPWQDRRIEAGTEWFDVISQAMEECNIAVLLISPDFIASPFIQDKELSRLFQRRLDEGLRVIPIIVRPCMWKDEPVIKDLQVIPRDGKAVISFSKENGDRDQVWAEIGNTLRNLVV